MIVVGPRKHTRYCWYSVWGNGKFMSVTKQCMTVDLGQHEWDKCVWQLLCDNYFGIFDNILKSESQCRLSLSQKSVWQWIWDDMCVTNLWQMTVTLWQLILWHSPMSTIPEGHRLWHSARSIFVSIPRPSATHTFESSDVWWLGHPRHIIKLIDCKQQHKNTPWWQIFKLSP